MRRAPSRRATPGRRAPLYSAHGHPTKGGDCVGDAAKLFDAHCHLDWFESPADVAGNAADEGLSLLAVTVSPEGFRRARELLAGMPAAHVAAGLHPWWLLDGRCGRPDVDDLCELASRSRLVGEVGLDFSARRCPDDASRRLQLEAFERVCRACAEASDPRSPHVLSVHAVRSADAVLDVLERTGAAGRCRCVLHWFSGTSDELVSARRLGCWLSLGERALATRRGREYARVCPADRLLVETDLPPLEGEPMGARDVVTSLEGAIAGVASARGMRVDEARRLTTKNGLELIFG